MADIKYLLILLVLIAIVGYYFLFPKTIVNNVAVFDEDSCKELLTRHDPSIADMSFFRAGSDYHIDSVIGNTIMKYNISSDKQVSFISGDFFEGCSIVTVSPALLVGKYTEYSCNKEGVDKLFVETRSTENYFYANYKIVSGEGVGGKIVYMSPEFRSNFIVNVINKMIDRYGCEK